MRPGGPAAPTLLALALAAPAAGSAAARTVPFEEGLWKIAAEESRVEEHLGRKSLFLRDGTATVAGASLADGWLEFDVAFPAARGFIGGIWRVQDGGTYEEFYLRPHQSGNPDATQYTPVFHGVSGWQIYHGERYAVQLAHRFDQWVHVRILFAGGRAEVYLGDAGKPTLVIDELKGDPRPGSVGVSAYGPAPVHVSNFSFTAGTPPFQGGSAPAAPPPAEGAVPSWSVSDAFPEKALDGRTELAPGDLAPRRWQRLASEASGAANLARLQGADPPNDTVFARRTIRSESAQVKRMDIGWSDRVRVYLNGRLLFSGDDTFRSRDYRFLGSIGWFDSLYLPLTAGDNELVLAVTEYDLGGWAVQARFPDRAGLTFKD